MISGIGSHIADHPKSGLAALVIAAVAFVLLLIFAPPADRRAEIEAYDRAKLDCRQSGGNYEYFGSQGYHCIGGKK